MRIDAILNPAEIAVLPSRDLAGALCVVFDVLRATSTIITALAHGTEEIFPVRTIEEARGLKAVMPDAALAGERHGEKIEDFDFGNSPLEFREKCPRRVITTTTNGTIGLRACDSGREVLAASLLNLQATVDHVREVSPEELVLICAGTFETAAIEDIYAAGGLVAGLSGELSDSAMTAAAVWERGEPLQTLRASKNGRVLLEKGRGDEVEYCAALSRLDVVCRQERGLVRRVSQ